MVNLMCDQGVQNTGEEDTGLDSSISRALLKEGGFVLSLVVWVGFRVDGMRVELSPG